jgi:oligopeptidase B
LPDTPTPPRAAKRPRRLRSPFGSRTDPYYWLRDDTRQDPEVLAHLRAENAYTTAMLEPHAPLVRTLYSEIAGRIPQADASVPVRHNGYWYVTRVAPGQEHPVHTRHQGSMEAPEEVLLDASERAQGQAFYDLGALEVSPDNRLLAFAEDAVGRQQYIIRIRDLDTGEILPDTVGNAEAELAWADDSRTLLYIEKDPLTLLGLRVRSHTIGTPVADDRLVFEQEDDSFFLALERSRSGRFLFIIAESTLSSEWRHARSDDPQLEFRVAVPQERGHEYQLEDRGEHFILRSNWLARDFRIVEAPIACAGDRSTWRELVPAREGHFISGFAAFERHLAIAERAEGLRRIRVYAFDDGREHLIDAPDEALTMFLGENEEQATGTLRYVHTSPRMPPGTWDYDMASGERRLLKRESVPGRFDPDDYVVDFIHATVRDGTRVPVSLLRRRDIPRDGTAPLYQYAYGAYGVSEDPVFRPEVLSLVDRGFVHAVAHVRGGQELGRHWYEAGRLLGKPRSFEDFIDVTRFLVAEGYADPQRVFGMGESAGGLLIGAVANLAPAEYRALVAHVPFVDVLTSMLDKSLPLTCNEYDEWGDPGASREAFDCIRAYSPYDRVVAQDYPALWVTTGLWDSQVQYWEPVKWVARLRERKTDDRPVLLRAGLESGHGGKTGRFEHCREIAEEYAFILWQAGVV